MKVRANSMGLDDCVEVGGGGGICGGSDLGSPSVTGAAKVRFSVPSMEFVWETDPLGGKKVTFLVGMDGEPVVVVLGGGDGGDDGGDDVDTILQERARRQADLESDMLKRAAEEELDKLVRLSRSTVEAMEEEATRNNSKERDPAREAVVRSLQEATVEMEGQMQALEEAQQQEQQHYQQQQQQQEGLLPSALTTDNSLHQPASRTSSGSSSPSSGIGSLKSPLSSSPSSSLSSLSSNSSSSSSVPPSPSLLSNSSSSLPSSPPAFSISAYGTSFTTKKLNGLSVWQVQAKPPSQQPTVVVKPPILSAKPTLTVTAKPHPPPLSSTPISATTNTICNSSKSATNSLAIPPSPPSSLSLSSALAPSPPLLSLSAPSSPRAPSSPLTIIEKGDIMPPQHSLSPHSTVVGVAAQIRRFEQLCEGSLEALKTATLERARRRRQREILEQLRSQVEAARPIALSATSESDLKAWKEQERKAKEAEKRIREIARRAREEHRRAGHAPPSSPLESPCTPPPHFHNSPPDFLASPPAHHGPSTPVHAVNANLNGFAHHHTPFINGDINGNIKPDDLSNNNGVGGPCVRQRVRPPKPPSRAAIVTWFKEDELTRGAGLDPTRSHIAPWFHGIISRTEAEEVLSGAGVGYFLVRVSERIWGYAISYRGPDRCRHYLIDVSGGRYTFFGSHQAAHSTLSDLVEYHKHDVITVSGGELLTQPCGQPRPHSPDHRELFLGTPFLKS